MDAKERMVWPDVAKGCGILLVVFGHVWRGLHESHILMSESLFKPVDSAIYLFHMPLFFFVSGYFMVKTALTPPITAYVLRLVRTIVYPLFVWAYVTAVFRVLAGSLANRGAISLREFIFYPFNPLEAFWFLRVLFCLCLCFAVFVKITRGNSLACLFLFVILFSANVFDLVPYNDLYWRVFIYSPYFALGLLVSRLPLMKAVNSAYFLAATALFLLCEGALFVFPEQVDRIYLLTSLTATTCVIFIAVHASRYVSRPIDLLAGVGRLSLTIYVIHIIALAAVRILLIKLGISNLVVHIVAGNSVGLAVPILTYTMAQRYGLLQIMGLAAAPPSRIEKGQLPWRGTTSRSDRRSVVAGRAGSDFSQGG